ncbi:MAG: alpha/beta fold hydrolase, partial [Anaerolineales bacterium]|nr:alpha/beta fold hydrolase [Anaerolineales bacterium]
MKHLPLSMLLVCMALLLATFPQTKKTFAQAAQQDDSCENVCSCEGFTAENLENEELQDHEYDDNLQPITGSDCFKNWFALKFYYSYNKDEFLQQMRKDCEECRAGPSAPPAQESGLLKVLIEQDPYVNEDKSYIGVVADSVTYLSLLLVNNDPYRAMTATVSQPSLGIVLDMNNQEIEQGKMTIQPAGKVELRYFPPEYINESDLTERVSLDNGHFAYGAPVIVYFDFESENGDYREQVEKGLLIFRPPVILVHGYFGSPDTWEFFNNRLSVHKFYVFVGTYLPGWENSSIDDMAVTLKKDIDDLLLLSRKNYIKISRVDVVTHSMGGLITRLYIDNNPETMAVRKLIMLATPNHGVNDWQRYTRIAGSWWYKTQFFASGQLNADNNIFAYLNQYEPTLGHLNQTVEYANIIGQASCGPNCPDDAVVPIASAHMNGVVEYIFDKTIHSSSLHSLDVVGYSILPFGPDDTGITDSSLVVDKVIELLTTKILRANPDVP